MTTPNWDHIRDLQAEGWLVIAYSPLALEGLHPSDAEEIAWDAIDRAIERQKELDEEEPE